MPPLSSLGRGMFVQRFLVDLPVRIDEALPFACYREAVEHRSPGSAAQPRHPGYPIHGILRTLEGFYNGYRFVQPFQG